MVDNQELIHTDAFTWLKYKGKEFTNWPPGYEGEWPSQWPDEPDLEKRIEEFLNSTYYRTALTLPLDRTMEICMGDIIMNVRGAESISIGGVMKVTKPSLFDEDNFPYPRMNVWHNIGVAHLFYNRSGNDIPVTYEAVTIIDSELRNCYEKLPGFVKDSIKFTVDTFNNYELYPPKQIKFAGKK